MSARSSSSPSISPETWSSDPSARASRVSAFPVHIDVEPAVGARNRITTAFRLFLAIPHLILVGGAIAMPLSWTSGDRASGAEWGAGGVLGAAAIVVTVIAWFAILLTGHFPHRLYDFGVGVLRWTTRVEAYLLLLRDEYPPFPLA